MKKILIDSLLTEKCIVCTSVSDAMHAITHIGEQCRAIVCSINQIKVVEVCDMDIDYVKEQLELTFARIGHIDDTSWLEEEYVDGC